jgi:HK97 family phage major capsid protein/HK97 family phage prohead protease
MPTKEAGVINVTVETIKQKELFRRFLSAEAFEIRQAEGEPKTLSFAASSEQPVERWYGNEVLSHEPGAVKLGRAQNGAMPLLFNHDVGDPLGMITGARLKGGRMIVDATLFATARAAEILTMIDGGLRNVSLAYRVNVLEENTKTDTYTATDWEPYEVSIVTVPADPSVGIGRGVESEYDVRMIRSVTPTAELATTRRADMTEDKAAGTVSAVGETEAVKQSGAELEQRRKKAIETLCRMNKLDDKYRDNYIAQGWSLEEAAEDMLLIIEERGRSNPQSVAKLGMERSDVQKYSLTRMINAHVTGDFKLAGLELECSREVAKRMGKSVDPHRFLVPFEVLQRAVPLNQPDRRDLTVSSAGGGGYLVATENLGFIDILRNRSVAFRMGARRLSGLMNSVTIPRMSASGTAYWLATEGTAATESQQTFQQVALTPKTAAAYTEISRQLLLQSSPGAEGIVTDDLAQIVAIAADLAVLNGSGTGGQPQGIIQAGIGSVAAGSMNYAAVLEFQTDLATANVRPSAGGYVTTPSVAALAKQRQRFTSTDTPLWVGNIWDGNIEGFPAMSSNQMPAASMLFGDFSEVVVGEWGVLEIEVNPYANFQAGIVGVRCLYSLDVGVRRPYAFSAMATIS